MISRRRLYAALAVAWLCACNGEPRYARVIQIEDMAQTIGGPAAAARPGDYLLENDKLRAVVHGRHNERSTAPLANGSLMDLDLQRPDPRFGAGRGKDAFYELGPMVNLKVSSSSTMSHGLCQTDPTDPEPSLGAAPCPIRGCARVSAVGRGENIIGLLGLLDAVIERKYADEKALEIATDYDVCPGEEVVRVTTTVRYFGKRPEAEDMEELHGQSGLMDVLLGEHTGVSCTQDKDCGPGESCTHLLQEDRIPTIKTEMRRCRRPDNKQAGVLAGDFILFSGKVKVFIEGSGFDHESFIRSVFDTGGDIFSSPLSRSFLAGVGDGVSYAYFNAGGDLMVPVFAEAFTAAMSNRLACPQQRPDCFKDKELRFRRYLSVGKGDVASALAGFYKVRGIPTGTIEGHVLDARSQGPLSKIDVFVFRLPTSWGSFREDEIRAKSFQALVDATVAETKSQQNPEGLAGPISHFKSDVGMDLIPDGSFSGPLPEGRYVLMARAKERPSSGLIPIQVNAGGTVRATVIMGEPGVLQYEVQDVNGRPLPSKLTIGHCFAECARTEDCPSSRPVCEATLCVPEGGYTDPNTCRPDQIWDYDPVLQHETCRCPSTGLLPLMFGGERYADNTVRMELTSEGRGQLFLEPGLAAYQVIVSRGFEYEISRHFVSIQPNTISRLQTVLPQVVDTRGWISADFHVHGPNSVDSGLDERSRILSYAAEGVELVSASDHDHLTDYAPTIQKLGLQSWLKSQIGVEVSPLSYGHFIGFPLRFDATAELNGAFHWLVPSKEITPDGTDFEALIPAKIFQKLRELGSLGLERTVVFIAHFYDHFSFYRIDPWTMEPPGVNALAKFDPVLNSYYFKGDFDALEGFNGKNQDLLRRPSYTEVRGYNRSLAELVRQSSGLSPEERQRRWSDLAATALHQYLHRSKEEQAVAIRFTNKDFQCSCMTDEECGPGSICDEGLAACIASCKDDTACKEAPRNANREKCLPFGEAEERRTCQRVPLSCTADEQCSFIWKEEGTAGKEFKEKCLARVPGSDLLTCELPCTKDKDCAIDELRPKCDTGLGICTALTTAAPSDPCPAVRGTVDDWFQLLNHGIRRPMLGNSDSHTLYSIEAGVPRNYVRSSTDQPAEIQSEEVAAQIKAMASFPTYGPFIDFAINDHPVGSVVSLPRGEGARLKLKVQSPLWFDVDRVEIYRNGQLIQEIEGKTDCKGEPACILVPNRSVVNYEGILVDVPDRDSWYVVVAMGLDGKSLAPVYSSTPVPRLGMFEVIQRLAPLLPPLRSFRTPLSPSMIPTRPYAISNPIWVDVGGDGILEPINELPGWATAKDRELANQTLGLTSSSTEETESGHDHRPGLDRMRLEAQAALRNLHLKGRADPLMEKTPLKPSQKSPEK